MKVHILRGKEHIGGNIIKVTEGESSVLLDCGALLPEIGQPRAEDDFDMAGIGRADALFLSHHHGDHSDLLEKLPPEVELFASPETLKYMTALDRYLDRPLRVSGRKVHKMFHGEGVWIGKLRVSAFAADHSAEGALMFLVEGGGKRLLYTGDFRQKPDIPPKPVDLLITEGTMLTRNAQTYPDEAAVETALRPIMRETNGRIFVLQSSANLSRIRTVLAAYRGASRDGSPYGAGPAAGPLRPIMQDVFLKFFLEHMGHQDLAAPYAFVWNGFDRDGARTYDRILRRYCAEGAAASCRRIADFSQAVVFIRPRMLNMLEKLIADGMDVSNDALIFSMWRGYGRDRQTAALLGLFAGHGVKPQYIHTSGHAHRQCLEGFIRGINPAKLACIHSENAEGITGLADGIPVVPGTMIEL